MNRTPAARPVLVHLASGVGNIVLATPLLKILDRDGFAVDVLVDGDYPDAAELLEGWSAVRTVRDGRRDHRRADVPYAFRLPAIPPFYWSRYASYYARVENAVRRPPDALFYRDEQAYYLEFARSLGCEVRGAPYYFLPTPPEPHGLVDAGTLVLAPGCKTGEMATKRWPYFAQLAATFEDVVLVGTRDDLWHPDGTPMHFPGHVRSFVDRLSLRETAGILAAAGAVVANDSGLGHMAGAIGTATVLLFGPTPHLALGPLPPNVTVLRSGLACEPCWYSSRFAACARRVDCLSRLNPDAVAAAIREMMSC